MPELDIQGILERLAAAGVDYIVIGGVAVGFHGYVRATKDLDIVPASDQQNLERLAKVLRALNAELDGAGDFDAAELPDPLDPEILAHGGNWVLQTQLGRFEDLVALKQQAARPSDLEDLERLRQARGE